MSTNIKENEIKIFNFSQNVKKPQKCPYCKELTKGPFSKYKKREYELYFDLEKKYLHCEYCGQDIEVVDFEVLIARLSSKFPPKQARTFSIKNNILFDLMPEKMGNLLSMIQDEYEEKVVLPFDNLVCIESTKCNYTESNCHCARCIHKIIKPNQVNTKQS
jgi:hypothetical protein